LKRAESSCSGSFAESLPLVDVSIQTQSIIDVRIVALYHCATILISVFGFEGSNMFSPALVARLCLALLCFSPLNVAHAAPTPGETDLIRERQDRLLEEQRR
jgi:hypothetical protein